MITLDSSVRKLQALLSGAVTTTECPMMVTYRVNPASPGQGQTTPVTRPQRSTTTGNTAVDILDAPGDSRSAKTVTGFSFVNVDTAVVSLTLRLYDNGVTTGSIGVFTLQVGDALYWSESRGFYAKDSNGNEKTAQSSVYPYAKFTLNAASGATVAAQGDLTGAAFVSAGYSAVGAANLTTRTAALMFADIPGAKVGDKYVLLITNTSGGTTTLVAGTGVTLTGTMTLATNTTRMFIVTLTSQVAVTIQSVSIGTIG